MKLAGDGIVDVELPITRGKLSELAESGVTHIRVKYPVDLYDLIDFNGLEDMNNFLDEVAGVILTDISYYVGTSAGDSENADEDDTTVWVYAVGSIEEF